MSTESDGVIYTYEVIPNGIYMPDDLDKLPNGLNIFTLPITGSFQCKVDIENIYRYFPLTPGNIVTIKSKFGFRTIQQDKKILTAEDDENFMNQLTLIMSIKTDKTLTKCKYVNVKFFDNNSFQISGLKSVFQINYTINKLANLFRGKFVIYTYPNKKKSHFMWEESSRLVKKTIQFFDQDEIWVNEPTISVINVVFKYMSKINQTQFYYKMQELKLHCKVNDDVVIPFQPDITSPVTIWLPYKEDTRTVIITIYIFESGSITIMACRKLKHIVFAYEFIQKILLENNDYIVKKDLVSIIENDEDIRKYIDLEALYNIADQY